MGLLAPHPPSFEQAVLNIFVRYHSSLPHLAVASGVVENPSTINQSHTYHFGVPVFVLVVGSSHLSKTLIRLYNCPKLAKYVLRKGEDLRNLQKIEIERTSSHGFPKKACCLLGLLEDVTGVEEDVTS